MVERTLWNQRHSAKRSNSAAEEISPFADPPDSHQINHAVCLWVACGHTLYLPSSHPDTPSAVVQLDFAGKRSVNWSPRQRRIPSDHMATLLGRELMRDLIETLKAEQST